MKEEKQMEKTNFGSQMIEKNFGIHELHSIFAAIGICGEEAKVRIEGIEINLSTRNVKTFALDDQDITDIVRDAMAEPRNPKPKN